MSSHRQVLAYRLSVERRALTLLCLFASIVSTLLVPSLTAQLWQPADLQATIGRLEGDDAEVFGSIRTIEVDAAGNMYILDQQTSGIHVFDQDGVHITSHRRRGQGPREVLGILGSDLDSEGILHVADVANARISAFELVGDSLVFSELTTLTFQPQDVCVLGRRRYVLHRPAATAAATISEIDGDGRVVSRFAKPEEPQGAEQRRVMAQTHFMLNWGFIACDEASRTIVKFNRYVPVVRAFDPEGEVLWETTLEDYVPWKFTLIRSTGRCCMYSPDPDEGFSHSGRSVVTDEDGSVLLGLQIEGARGTENLRHELVVLDVSSGRVIDRQPTIGAVGSVGNGFLFTLAEDPFPQVRVFSTR